MRQFINFRSMERDCMVFSSTEFLFLFLPALLILYFFPWRSTRFTGMQWRNAALLAFSVGFYAWGEPVFVFIMLFFTLLNWLFGLEIAKRRRAKFWTALALSLDLLLLIVFKYASFISENLAKLSGNDRLIVEIALPIGISFFTFQMMSYIIDVYQNPSMAQKNPLYVLLYISLFPQLIAGPIVRYGQIAPEIEERETSFDNLAEGMRRFVYGLGKKVLLADFLAQVADNAFAESVPMSVASAWIGADAYALQIYFDFSGYSDMAIGLGRMFGFHFLENFRYPYISKSVTEFWRRWHISLSAWFRDYVYIPLGGNRVNKSRWIWNLFVVWSLTGLWHGADWRFLCWGLLYFAVLLFEKWTRFPEKLGRFAHIYAMLIVTLAWVLFRADNIGHAMRYLGQMFGIGASALADRTALLRLQWSFSIFLLALVGATPLPSKLFGALRRKNVLWAEPLWLAIVFSLSVIETVSSTYHPFIYFNF